MNRHDVFILRLITSAVNTVESLILSAHLLSLTSLSTAVVEGLGGSGVPPNGGQESLQVFPTLGAGRGEQGLVIIQPNLSSRGKLKAQEMLE